MCLTLLNCSEARRGYQIPELELQAVVGFLARNVGAPFCRFVRAGIFLFVCLLERVVSDSPDLGYRLVKDAFTLLHRV